MTISDVMIQIFFILFLQAHVTKTLMLDFVEEALQDGITTKPPGDVRRSPTPAVVEMQTNFARKQNAITSVSFHWAENLFLISLFCTLSDAWAQL